MNERIYTFMQSPFAGHWSETMQYKSDVMRAGINAAITYGESKMMRAATDHPEGNSATGKGKTHD